MDLQDQSSRWEIRSSLKKLSSCYWYHLSAINAYNNLNATSNQMNSTVAELSSGLQIQTAAQDASGYVISQLE